MANAKRLVTHPLHAVVLAVAMLLAGTPTADAAGNGQGSGGPTKTVKAGLACTDTKNFSVQALHPSTFYVDPASDQDSQWVGYMVTFKTGLPAGASLTTPAGARLVPALGGSRVELTLTKDATANYYKTYALLRDSGADGSLSHTVSFSDASGKRTTCTYAFTAVQRATEDQSNVINSVDTANATAGVPVGVAYVDSKSDLIMTVRGSTGILEKGNRIVFSPTPSVTWPTNIGLTLTNIRWRVGGNQFYKDRLWATGKANQDAPYVVEYTFSTQVDGATNWTLRPSINVSDPVATVHSKNGASGSFTSIAVPNTTFYAVRGRPFTMTSSLIGGSAPFAWTLASGTLPVGLALDSSSGNVTGTPSALGSSDFNLRVVDKSQRSGNFRYTIRVFDRAIVTNDPPMAEIDKDYSYGPFQAFGFTGKLKWSFSGKLPKGLQWDDQTQTISGRVGPNAADDEFSLTVTDEKGDTSSRTYKMRVSKTKIPTPINADAMDLYLGEFAYGADFDSESEDPDAVQIRRDHGRNYGYVTIYPIKPAGGDTETDKSCDARRLDDKTVGEAKTVKTDPNGGLARDEFRGLVPSTVIGLPPTDDGQGNLKNLDYCVEAQVFVENVNSRIAGAQALASVAAKNVRLEIDIPLGSRIDNDPFTNNRSLNLQKGDVTWNVDAYPGNRSSATPEKPVCTIVSGFTRVVCDFGTMTTESNPSVSVSKIVKLPVTVGGYVNFLKMRAEVTTPSQEIDEMPSFEPVDLRHPNNVAVWQLARTYVKDLRVELKDNVGEKRVDPVDPTKTTTISGLYGSSKEIPWNAGPVKVYATAVEADDLEFRTNVTSGNALCRVVPGSTGKRAITVPDGSGGTKAAFEGWALVELDNPVESGMWRSSSNSIQGSTDPVRPHEGYCAITAVPILYDSNGDPLESSSSATITVHVVQVVQKVVRVDGGGTQIVRGNSLSATYQAERQRDAVIDVWDKSFANLTFATVSNGPDTGTDSTCVVSAQTSPNEVTGQYRVTITAPSSGSSCKISITADSDTHWHKLRPFDQVFTFVNGSSDLPNCVQTNSCTQDDPKPSDPFVPTSTLQPLILNAESPRPVTTKDTKKFASNVGITVASQPMILVLPGVPAGARLYPTDQTGTIIKGKVLLAQDPDTGGLIVQSDNGWTGKLKVPLIYFLNTGTGSYVGNVSRAFVRGTAKSSEADVTGAAQPMPSGKPMEVLADITIYPDPSPKGVYGPVKVASTTVVWEKSPTRMVFGYQLLSNGKVVCTVNVAPAQRALIMAGKFATVVPTSCKVPQLIGPKAKFRVVAIGGDDTRSEEMTPKYSPTGPALTLTINFDESKSVLTPKAVGLLANLARTIRIQGFSEINVKGFTDVQGGTSGALKLSKARVSSTVAYLKARLPGVKFTGTGYGIGKVAAKGNNAKSNAINRRAEISVR